MFLTHVDPNGDDSPAILIENSTAANRAVNIPEFVNVPYDGFQRILTPAADFYTQFNVASDLTERGKYAAAVLAWQKALALNEKDDRAHNSYAVALASTGRLAEAVPHFERAIALNPGYDEAYNSYGAALMSAGRLDEAIPRLEHAIALNPDNPESLSNLGAALAQAGRLDQAIARFERSVELDPEYVAGQANLGGALMQKGEAARAVEHFEKAVSVDGSSAPLRSTLGFALLSLGRSDDALLQFRKAADSDPRSAAAHEGLGSLEYTLHRDTRAALAEWRRALAAEPGRVGVLVQSSWALATTPDATLRNGPEAVARAQRAVQATGGAEPYAFDALAAAYAESGRFTDAVQAAGKGVAAARAQGNTEVAAAIASRQELYKAGKPYRETH
jgi:tetratricopeptide (TPR) repeat protein